MSLALRRSVVAPMALIVALLACNVPGADLPTLTPTVTPPPAVTATAVPTALPAIATALQASPAPPTELPATAAPTSTPTTGGVSSVLIFLIALEDNGVSGPLVGCGDSVVGVERSIPPTQAPLRAALNELLAIRDQYYGLSGLYNALYQADLTVGDVTIDSNGLATIHLSGTLMLGGTCDSPRAQAQLEYTALQFSTVRSVQIFINDVPLADWLSQR